MRDLASILSVYNGSNGDATKALYADLEKLGPVGVIAMNLFRACKCSERAKVYRGCGYRGEAYQRKDWSISNLAKALDDNREHPALVDDPFVWGWNIDRSAEANGSPHFHVIYIEIPTGQVSFHLGARHVGPDYTKPWDRAVGTGPDRICRWVAQLFEG